MPAEKTLALVLRVVEFSETSVICTLFTRDFGKVHALAKGARRPKGPFESALDLLSLCRILFLRKSSDALDLLTEAKLERRFRPAAGGLACLYAGYYVAELLNELTTDGDPHPDLFDAAEVTLQRLSSAGDWRTIVLQFELTALRLLGHLPNLDDCVECGTPIEPAGRVPFGQLAGGVLCTRCRSGQKQVVSLSREALLAMRQLTEFTSSLPAPVESRVVGELRGLISRYVTNLVGHLPRMYQFLGA